MRASLATIGAAAGALLVLRGLGSAPEPFPAPPPAVDRHGPIVGETYLWRPVAIGGGGFITGLASDATGATMLARTDVHGAYRWSGNRWVQLVTATSMPRDDRVQDGMNEGAYEVAVAPRDPSRLYLAIKGRVYRSDDAGRAWRRAGEGAPFPLRFQPNGSFRFYGPHLAVSPDDPNLVLLGTVDGVLLSRDGGTSWATVPTVPAPRDLRPEPGVQTAGAGIWFDPVMRGRRRTVLIASPGNGMLVADTRTMTFRPLAPGGPATVAQATILPDDTVLAVDHERAAVWQYRAGTWTDLTKTSNLTPRPYVTIASDRAGSHVILLDEGGRGWCSADGGDRWSSLSRTIAVGPGDPPWLHVANQGYFATGAAMFDPRRPNHLLVGAGTGVFEGDLDAGCGALALQSRTRGIEELVATDVVQPTGGAPLFAALDFGIHVKPDLDAFSTTYGPRERVIIAAQQLDWSERNPRFVVTNASDTRTDCCAEDGNAVMAGFSTDGGQSWRKFATLPQPPGTKADDPWRMAFGTIAVSAGDTGNIVWVPGYDRSPFYTTDRGATWHRVALPGEVLPLTGSFADIWVQRKTLAADRVVSGTFYWMHSGGGTNAELAGLWRTIDGGRHWSRQYFGEIVPGSGGAAKLRAVPDHAGNLFFTPGGGDGAPLMRSRDGGASWQRVAHAGQVDDIAFGRAAAGQNYPAIYLSGRIDGAYGIWRSVDDARSWSRIAGFPLGRLDQVTVIAADRSVFGRVYVGYMGSGWLYGEPSACRPAALRAEEDRSCEAVLARP